MALFSFGRRVSPWLTSCSLIALSSVVAQANDWQSSPAIYDGSIGGRVWWDADQDGLQSEGEETLRGINGAPMRIFNQRGEEMTRTFSGNNGIYAFDGLPYGYYKVQFAKPRGCRMTLVDVFNNQFDNRDSDANPSNGLSHWIEITPENTKDFSIDVGYACGPETLDNTIKAVNDKVTTGLGELLLVNVLENDRVDLPVTLTILDSDVPGYVDVIQSRVVIADTQASGNYMIRYRIEAEDGSSSEAEVAVTIQAPAPIYGANRPNIPEPANRPRPVSRPQTTSQARPPVNTSGPNFSAGKTIARDDTVQGSLGETLRINVLANDSLADIVDFVRVLYTDVPGSVEVLNNRMVVKDTDVTGIYTVSYELGARDGSTDIGTVTVNLTEPPEPTIAKDDAAEGFVGDVLLIDLLSNDTPSEDIRAVTILDDNIPGNLFINDNYDLVIDNTRSAGEFFVTYGLESTSGSRAVANVTVNLFEPESLIPTIARDDRIAGKMGERLIVDILANDSPSDGVAQVNLIDSNVQGSVSLDEQNRLVIDKNTIDGDAGVFVVDYELVSTSGSTDTAQVIVTIEAVKKR